MRDNQETKRKIKSIMMITEKRKQIYFPCILSFYPHKIPVHEDCWFAPFTNKKSEVQSISVADLM